jgi:hypothetical protein
MYLEDKGAAKETGIYSQITQDAESYLDILENKTATYTLFEKLQEHFNGDIFPLVANESKKVRKEHLTIIKHCLLDGYLSNNMQLFSFRIFRFDIIQIELLSEIYENFLEEFKEKTKEEGGQYYTPPSLVELILNEKLPVEHQKDFNIRILDPACGSGIFLVESFKRLVKRWKNSNPSLQIEFKDLRKILKDNIYGIEFDPLAIRVTAFSLYLAMVEQLNPKTLWSDKRYKFPHLISDIKEPSIGKGGNLMRADTIGEVNVNFFGVIDLLIGNPPFGTKIKLKSIKDFCISYGYGQDMVIPFLRKAIDFCPNGIVALIFNTKILTNTEGPFQHFRKWLFNETYVEKVYNLSIFRKTPKTFGGQLFTSAVGPVSIIFYQKNAPRKNLDVIQYWAPKTYVKNSLIEGVVIDGTDIKYLPREECQKPDTKIWKVAMWGSLEDFILIEKLRSQFINLETHLSNNNIKNGVGFQLLTQKTDTPKPDEDISKMKYLDADRIELYYTDKISLQKVNGSIKTKKAKDFYLQHYKKKFLTELPPIDIFRRLGEKEAYNNPHFVVKKGTENGFPCASFLDYNCSFRDGVYGFYSHKKNTDKLKIIVAYINSIISKYYLFISNSSYGIEREQIMLNEFLDLPFPALSEESERIIIDLLEKYIVEKKSNPFSQAFPSKGIDVLLMNAFGLSTNEQYLINDAINLNIDLFLKGKDSIALRQVDITESRQYANLLCQSINTFINDQAGVSATIYDIPRYIPLNLVVLKFGGNQPQIREESVEGMQDNLKFLDKATLKKESKSIYVKKVIKYFDGDTIYLIKPNQKRFWSLSTALNDARDLISDILKM